jgi:hypothetical protein
MSSFSKITPEKVWSGTGEPNWVSVNGGTITGNLAVSGSVTAATFSGAVSLPATLTTATTSGTSQTITTANTALVTYGTSYPLVSGAKYIVSVPFALAVTAHTFTGGATSGTLGVNVQLGVNGYPANFVQTFTIAGATGNVTQIEGNACFALTPGSSTTSAPILSAICLGGLASVTAIGTIDGTGGSQVAVVKIA